MAYDTLEEAQSHILELEGQLDNLRTEKETLSQNNETLLNENEKLRTLNQKYFNKLIAQEENTKEDKNVENENIPTCEEFATQLGL